MSMQVPAPSMGAHDVSEVGKSLTPSAEKPKTLRDKKKVQKAADPFSTLEEDYAKLNAAFDAQSAAFEVSSQEDVELKSLITQCNSNSVHLKSVNAQLNSDKSQLQAKYTQSCTENALLRSESSKLNDSNTRLKKSNAEVRASNKRFRDRLVKKDEQYHELEQRFQKLQVESLRLIDPCACLTTIDYELGREATKWDYQHRLQVTEEHNEDLEERNLKLVQENQVLSVRNQDMEANLAYLKGIYVEIKR